MIFDIKTPKQKRSKGGIAKKSKKSKCVTLEDPRNIGFPFTCYSPIRLELNSDNNDRVKLKKMLKDIVCAYQFELKEKSKDEIAEMFLKSLDESIASGKPSYEAIKLQEATPRREKKYIKEVINAAEMLSLWARHLQGLLHFGTPVRNTLNEIQEKNYRYSINKEIDSLEDENHYLSEKEKKENIKKFRQLLKKRPDFFFDICKVKLNEFVGFEYSQGSNTHHLMQLISLCQQRLKQLPEDIGGQDRSKLFTKPQYMINVLADLFTYYTGNKPKSTSSSGDANDINFSSFVIKMNEKIFKESNIQSLGLDETIETYIKKVLKIRKNSML